MTVSQCLSRNPALSLVLNLVGSPADETLFRSTEVRWNQLIKSRKIIGISILVYKMTSYKTSGTILLLSD